MDTFGRRLVASREKHNISQKELAEQLGITPTRLNYWEKDKREPAIEMIKLIAQVLEVDANYLIGYQPQDKEPPSTAEAAPGGSRISMEESNRLLVALGLIKEGQDLSDDDLAFLEHIVGLLDAWFDKRK